MANWKTGRKGNGARRRQLPMAAIMGQDTRASCLVTISECSPLTKDVKANISGLLSGDSLALNLLSSHKCHRGGTVVLQDDKCLRLTSSLCEGGVDVVGVVTHLVRGIAQVLHGDQVVELSVQLEVQESGKKRKRQGRTGRSRRGESRTQGETHMNMDDK